MKRYFFVVLFVLGLFFSLKIYSQNTDIYTIIELLPDSENIGLNLLYKYTSITMEINPVESGWIDILDCNRHTEYYTKFYVEETKMYYIIILSQRYPGIIYYKNWEASNEQFNVTFFKRNNDVYFIIDYRGGSGGYYGFSIYEYQRHGSPFNNVKMVYENFLGFHGWLEYKDGKIIFHKDNITYLLSFKDDEFELLEFNE